MDPRTFDGLTKGLVRTAGVSRRRLVQALPALAAAALLPRAARAWDGGNPVVPVGTGPACASGADCVAGDVCVNGVCQTLAQASSGASSGQPAAETPVGGAAAPAAPGETPAAGGTAETPQVLTPEAGGLGGQISPEQPLAARVFAGSCGQLGTEAAFQLIDIGPLGGAGSPAPVGSTTAIPARTSTTVIESSLTGLLATEHAVDVRLDAADPASSIACGNIGGRLGGQTSASELAIGLGERSNSGYAGIAWLRQQGERTVVDVFVAQGLEEGAQIAGGLLAPAAATTTPAPTAAPAETPAAPTPVPASAETPAAPTTTPEAAAAQATAAPESLTPTPTVIQPPTPAAGAAEAAQAAAPATPAAAAFTIGQRLLTTTDVNLRASPSTDGAVIATLGTGIELEVTGAPSDGWVPVREVATDRRGFVSAEFVQAA